ncbi:VTT domain-containing protein [Thioalkalivibrio thiocyanodenitrificans]|uniref:VTT domain-containing protein n=1 Tax=Thioalkalivibrio thiocyanodenitrificans TaxID=243063 RepID=UPI0003AB0AF2|nr:VTT domain-containing protein [Thioalkalivibrio thiocyanodenitrificans]
MGNGRIWMRIVLVALVVAGILVAIGFRDRLTVEGLEVWIGGLGASAPWLFMGVYALAAVFFLPGSVLTLAGGVLFGPVWGSLYSLVGATAGATLAFLVSRYVASDWVSRRAGGKVATLIRGVEQEGWRFVAFTRLVPLFPYNLLNYALGLTRIPLVPYVLATFVCMAPGAIAYTYLGFAGREAVAGGENLIRTILIALALLAVALFIPRLVTRLRRGRDLTVREVQSALDEGRLTLLDVRGPDEFAKAHVAGAVPIPVDDLLAAPQRVAEAHSGPLALICRTDRRSAKAQRALARAGVTDARVVQGGMEAWERADLPVVRPDGS